MSPHDIAASGAALAGEPRSGAFRGAISTAFFATRPAFLTVTAGAWLMGMASSVLDGVPVGIALAGLCLLFALVAHAGVNVLNDYYDAIDGVDAPNTARVFPFTGGSRFIQNGVLSVRETAYLGYGLLAAVVPAGVWLAFESGSGLLAIGMAGLFVGWAYSARPLSLMRRGWGEPCVGSGFLLIVIGTDFVQRGEFSAMPVAVGLSYALLVTNILFLNQFPDHDSDAATGKRNWVVRLGPQHARWIYPAIALTAYAWWITLVARQVVPGLFALALIAVLPSAFAAWQLFRHAAEPARLAPSIRATIAAALSHAILVVPALWYITRGIS